MSRPEAWGLAVEALSDELVEHYLAAARRALDDAQKVLAARGRAPREGNCDECGQVNARGACDRSHTGLAGGCLVAQARGFRGGR